jgi:tetratricopeptide (TPR) repeat protein
MVSVGGRGNCGNARAMVRRAVATAAAIVLASAPAGRAQLPETLSLLGKPLVPPPLSEERRRALEADLAAARAAYDKDPTNADALIWLGRRTAYLGRFGEAIEIYTRAIEIHPDDARLYRHRGHRYITLRKFDLAIKDLRKAAELVDGKPDEVEPDGQPNAKNVPTSTLQTNIYYHLGLALYLKADFNGARDAYRRCVTLAKNPDMLVAATAWLYMTLRRLGLQEEAGRALDPIAAGMEIVENEAYYRLLLLYKGLAPQQSLKPGGGADAVTIAYALANRTLYEGNTADGMKQMKALLGKYADQWPAFAFIAAEADVARLDKPRSR